MIQEGFSLSIVREVLVNCLVKLAKEKKCDYKVTNHLDMTIAVDLDVKT